MAARTKVLRHEVSQNLHLASCLQACRNAVSHLSNSGETIQEQHKSCSYVIFLRCIDNDCQKGNAPSHPQDDTVLHAAELDIMPSVLQMTLDLIDP